MGLSTSGISLDFGQVEIWDQDQSIMGWTCGYGIAAPRDVAKFFFDLLGPKGDILSTQSIETMYNFNTTDLGFQAGMMHYGGGLMAQSASQKRIGPQSFNLSDPAVYIGHVGATYGFKSTHGFFPSLNASVSAIVNVDFDREIVEQMLCQIT